MTQVRDIPAPTESIPPRPSSPRISWKPALAAKNSPVTTSWKKVVLLLLLTLGAELLLDSTLWNYPVSAAIIKLLYGWCLLTFLFCCLSSCKYVGMALMGLFGAVLAIFAYAKWMFGYDWTADLVLATLQTTWKETSMFLNIFSIGLVLIATAFCAYLSLLYSRYVWNGRFAPVSLILWGIVTTLWCCVPWAALQWKSSLTLRLATNEVRNDYAFYVTQHVDACLANWHSPFNYIGRSLAVMKAFYAPAPIDKVENYPSQLKANGPVTFVFVIGESVRADHFGLHGSPRNTTPLLHKRKGIIPLNQMKSYGISTYPSLVCLLTGKPDRYAAPARRSSFLALLKKHGFHTSIFLENTYNFSVKSTNYPAMGAYLDKSTIVKGDMEHVVESVRKSLLPEEKNQFIVLENGTGHFPYQYHPRYSYYQPCNHKWNEPISGHETEIINDYDNCIRAVDEMLDGLIGILEKRNAVLLFVSDHGQLLGEDGKWTYGNDSNLNSPETEKLHHVASFIWLSEAYRSKNPEMAARLERLRNTPLEHSYFFKSILSLCGITVEIPGLTQDFTQFEGDDDAQGATPVSAPAFDPQTACGETPDCSATQKN